ncbi:MAG: TetR/AcrR family transcriptional regulator [Alphaproteobacteria bacterium]|nr:TetR/AcrR family transcriptional regulator [Alphaproteobacteria bacterium]
MPRPRADSDHVPLTAPRIHAAALAIIDADGLDALTMRALAGRLGVTAASLYHVVSGKEALLAGIYEALLAGLSPVAEPRWDVHLRRLAGQWRDLLRAHPQLIPLFAARPPRSPAWLDQAERTFAVLRAAGLSADDTVWAFKTLSVLVIGQAANLHAPAPSTLVDQAPLARGEAAAVAGTRPVLADTLAACDGRDGEAWHAWSVDLLLSHLRERLPP